MEISLYNSIDDKTEIFIQIGLFLHGLVDSR